MEEEFIIPLVCVELTDIDITAIDFHRTDEQCAFLDSVDIHVAVSSLSEGFLVWKSPVVVRID